MYYIIDGDMLKSIADSIRNKSGSTDTITPEKMAESIDAIVIDNGEYKKILEGNFSSLVINSDTTKIRENAFYECNILTSISMPKVTDIGNSAFVDCSNITTASMPVVENIGDYAFQNCSGIVEVAMPKAKIIGVGAFQRCISLESVNLPEVTQISGNAFYGCSVLETVYAPKVTNIDSNAFKNCNSLYSIELGDTIPAIANGSFPSTLEHIYVPADAVGIYKADDMFSDYARIISAKEG